MMKSKSEEKVIVISKRDDKKFYISCGIPFLIGIIFTTMIFCDGGFQAWIDYATYGFGIETFFSWGGLAFIICGIVMFILGKNCEMKVTDKRINGKALFGNEVDIPIDSVSAVSKIKIFNGISVSSSSGLIKFLYLANINDLYKEISNLILNRNNKMNSISDAEELKKYKELLDSGAITKKEYEIKKKQMLGL